MRRFVLTTVVCLFLGLPAFSQVTWLEDWTAALRASASSGKLVLVDVTGSDWAPPARRQDLEVFSQPEFAKAADTYILLRLDFPHNASQSEKTRAQNAQLAKRFPLDNVPTTLLVDKFGFVWGLHEGAVDGGPQAYLDLAAELVKQKADLEALKKTADAAATATASAKATAFHAMFDRADKAGLAWEFSELPAQIIALDKGNKLGLANRYQVYNRYTRLLATWAGREDYTTVVKDLDDLAKAAKDQADLKQKIVFTRAMVQLNALRDELGARASFREALSLGADTFEGKRSLRLLSELP